MPHDAKGNLLKPGDFVNIPAVVEEIYENEGYCNCKVSFTHKMPPDNTETTMSAINTRQLEKV